jgi:cell division protein FtsZ
VVVGTVIDPEMTDELKVTVVATGLSQVVEKPVKVIDNTVRAVSGPTDYNQLDRPAVIRRKGVLDMGNAAVDTSRITKVQSSVDYLDIPAFLRRQAD